MSGPNLTTADWGEQGPPDDIRSITRYRSDKSAYGIRKVRPNGTVRWRGHFYAPPVDTFTKPVPGEWIELADYGPHTGVTSLCELTAPADPDLYIRRMFWSRVA